MDDAQQAAAAALTGSLLADFAADGDENAARLIQQEEAPVQRVAAQPRVAASAPPVAQAPAAPAVEAEAPEETEVVVDYSPKLSDELRDLLDEPDFDEEAADEVAAELESDEYTGEYVDPEVAKQLKALKKENEFLKKRVVESGRAKWAAENLRAYPLLAQHFPDEVKAISATSRRGFAREAAKLNARYEKALGPVLSALEDAKKSVAAGAVAQAREEVAQAWGTPASDTLPPLGVAKQEALEKARKAGDMKASLKVLMDGNPLI